MLVSKGLAEMAVLRPLALMVTGCRGVQAGLIVEKVDNRVSGELCGCSHASQGWVIFITFYFSSREKGSDGFAKIKVEEREEPFFYVKDEK